MNQPPKKPEDTSAPPTVELTLDDTGHRATIPDLRLEDTAAQQRRGLAVKGGVVGYNPYDTGKSDGEAPPLARPTREPPAPRKPTDLRKLSEWIRAQRRAQAVRQDAARDGEAEKPEAPTAAPGVRRPRR